jgi:uncharacterized protein (DUF488 family)
VTALRIFTIGHSTRLIGEFLEMLQGHGIRRLVDVRTVPRSGHNPQFNREDLAHALHNRRIHYRHMPALGGLRRPRRDSTNTAWRNASFRGYADYMQTPAFEENAGSLIAQAADSQAVIMCAEAVPWRCHRSLIADALLARGVAVEHIMSKTSRKPHSFTPFARIEDGRVTYPGLGI